MKRWILLFALIVSGCAEPSDEEARERAFRAIGKAGDVGDSFRGSSPLLLDKKIPQELLDEIAKIQWDDNQYSPFSTRCSSHDRAKGRHGEVFELSFYKRPPYCQSNPYDLIVSIKYNRWRNGFELVSWRTPPTGNSERIIGAAKCTNSSCVYHFEEKFEKGVSDNAVRARVGKFLLLKGDDADMALKIIEHTQNFEVQRGNMKGAKYECYIFAHNDSFQPKMYTGEVYELEKGPQENIYIDIDPLRVEWSSSDWIYFGHTISAIARTDATSVEDVDFADKNLTWHTKKPTE